MGKKPAALDFDNYDINICTHLILGGLCPHCATTSINHPNQLLISDDSDNASSSTTNKNKRKLLESQDTTKNEEGAKRKRGRRNNQEEKELRNLSWDCTTELKLYDDPWKIKKVLEKSDIDSHNRLLICNAIAEKLNVTFKDVNTNSIHGLVFKKWESSRRRKFYVFIKNWMKEFVVRRGLKEGDEIGLQWDPYYHHRFNFSVLVKAAANAN